MLIADLGATEILVQPGEWAEASDASRDAYRRKAKDLGIRLATDEAPGAEGKDVVVLVREGAYVAETFVPKGRCPLRRPGWEHVVRRELGFGDPCF